MQNLAPIEYQNERILTTEQLAQIYETDMTNITTNFNRNQDKFIEGKHYHLLKGEELKAFKSHLTNCNVPIEIHKFASQLYLWTKRGASRHCKMLGTDRAWEQFDILEENYFEPKLITDGLSPQLQLLINMELKHKELRVKVEAQNQELNRQAKEIKILDAKIQTYPTDFFSIAGYASLRGINVDISKARILGCAASKMSKENGYDTGSASDPRFGRVNTYHIDILKEIFKSV